MRRVEGVHGASGISPMLANREDCANLAHLMSVHLHMSGPSAECDDCYSVRSLSIFLKPYIDRDVAFIALLS
jgi:hypothetical protein